MIRSNSQKVKGFVFEGRVYTGTIEDHQTHGGLQTVFVHEQSNRSEPMSGVQAAKFRRLLRQHEIDSGMVRLQLEFRIVNPALFGKLADHAVAEHGAGVEPQNPAEEIFELLLGSNPDIKAFDEYGLELVDWKGA